MRVEPDGTEGQSEVRRCIQPAPEWATQANEEPVSGEGAGAWDIVRAAMVAGLDHREVGLGPSRVADVFMELEAYPRILEGVSRIGGLTDGRRANVFDTVFFG